MSGLGKIDELWQQQVAFQTEFIDMIKMTEETGVLVFWQIWILSSYVHMKKDGENPELLIYKKRY